MSRRRLFFALWPDAVQRDALRDAIGPIAKLVEGRHVHRRNWHVTTAFIGGFDEQRVPDLQARAAGIEVEPFRVRFDRVEFWPRPRVACLIAPVVPAELARLVKDLNEVLAEFDVPVEERTFRPHITIARRVRRFNEQRLARPLVTQWSGFELVESISRPGGATYRPVKQ